MAGGKFLQPQDPGVIRERARLLRRRRFWRGAVRMAALLAGEAVLFYMLCRRLVHPGWGAGAMALYSGTMAFRLARELKNP